MSNDVYGATVILMAVASLVAIGVSRHRVHTDQETLFWRGSGTIIGTVPLALGLNCRNLQRERLLQEVRGAAHLWRVFSDQWFELTRTVT
jgi:hypothetical protein